MTPITETETCYYRFQLRNIRPGAAALAEMANEDVRNAFEEVRTMLSEVQQGIAV